MSAGERARESPWATGAALAIVVLTVATRLWIISGQSLTYDEVVHLPAGVSYWRTGEVLLNPMHPPLLKELSGLSAMLVHSELPADPLTIRRMADDITYQREFGSEFFARNGLDRVVFWGRVAPVLLSAALSLVVLAWATELWGAQGGLLGVFLCAFDPTLTAHAGLVTTDVAMALASVLYVYLLRRYPRAPGAVSRIACGAALGIALATKFSAVLLVPIGIVLLALGIFAVRPLPTPRAAVRELAISVIVVHGVAYAVVWAAYLFPADPAFYARGLGTLGADNDPRYLHFFLGELRHPSWASYFAVAWLVKTPIAEILLALAALAAMARGVRTSLLDEAFLAIPLVALFVGYCRYADPIGLRYLLPCYPFLFVTIARLARVGERSLRARTAIAALAAWMLVDFVRVWPDPLSYFNLLAGGPRGGIRFVDDSNVDWGQGWIALRRYATEHRLGRFRFCGPIPIDPRRYGLDAEVVPPSEVLRPPPPGPSVVSLHCAARVGARLRELFGDGPGNWLAHREPDALVAHAYLVYEVPRP